MSAASDPSSGPAAATLSEILARWRGEPGALLPILHDVQHAYGHIPAQCVGEIAEALDLSRAEVHGVITYYPHFRTQPAGAHVVQVCQAESCRSMGAQALMAHAKQRLQCAAPGTSPDGLYTLEPVYCLGLCAMSPAITVDQVPHARLNAARFDRIVARIGGKA